MALIKCTECGKEFSDKAKSCPNCGCPTIEIINSKKMESSISNEVREEGEPVKEEVVFENSSFNTGNSNQIFNNTKPKSKTIGLIAGVIAVVAIIAVAVFFMTKSSRDYSKAQELITAGDFIGAEKIFKELGNYQDSEAMIKECEYQMGLIALQDEKFQEALKVFNGISPYKDSEEMIEKCNYELSTDGQFMRALSKGLMARWDKGDEYEEKGLVGEDPERYREFCQIELDLLDKFYDMTFANADLQADAIKYIDYLKEAQNATKQYKVNYSAYSQQWGTVYANRTILLQKMVTEYGLVVDADHQKTLDNMMIDATAAAENKKVKDDVAEMCKTFEVTVNEDKWGYKTYGLKMKNTTNLTFDFFYVDANFVDDQGNIITTGSGGNIESWKPNVEANANFWVDSQDVDISGYTIVFTPHYASGSYYE